MTLGPSSHRVVERDDLPKSGVLVHNDGHWDSLPCSWQANNQQQSRVAAYGRDVVMFRKESLFQFTVRLLISGYRPEYSRAVR